MYKTCILLYTCSSNPCNNFSSSFCWFSFDAVHPFRGWLTRKSVLSLYSSTRRFKESEWGPWGLENSFHMQSNKQKRISTLNDKLIASILNKTGIKMNYLEIWIRGGDKWLQKHIQIRLKIKQEFTTSKEMAVTWILGHTLPPILSIVSNTKCEASWDMTS